MRSGVRFVAILIVGLGLLTFLAYGVLAHATRDWFESDVAMRSRLLFDNARPQLAARWPNADAAALRKLLRDVTRNQHIVGSAACALDGRTLAETGSYPSALECHKLLQRIASEQSATPQSAGHAQREWLFSAELPKGRVHVSALRVASDDGSELGTLVLVHDLSYLGRREDKVRNLLLLGFGVLGLAASLITLAALRMTFRGWMSDLRRFLRGQEHRPEFAPLMKDVRALMQDLSNEQNASVRGRWTPERLKSALNDHLSDERLVIVANREPYIHERNDDGSLRVTHPASGLVTALEPVMRACSGVWVAHGSGSADREASDSHGRLPVPPGERSYTLRRVWLSEAEEQGYYYGFSNEGLWPLCHLAHTRPSFRAADFEHYRAVNRKFAEAVCEEVDSDDPIVLVQDYHFALAPKMIRERLPRATILTFWHIPWPNAERFGICPWRQELLDGMLGSSIMGFHTQQHCNNFLESVDTFVEARIDRERNTVVQGAHATQVRPYPISIEWPVHWLDGMPEPAECRREVIEQLELRPDALIGVGVDRMDYTKGIEERLLAVDRMLERFPALKGRFTFIQLAAPSRTRITRYRDLNDTVEALAKTINDKHGSSGYKPIVLFRAHHEPRTVFKFYRAADVCYVSSLHDGMNLVAKEFVAARDDQRGVLVLSHFTGAARELTEALIVNPYDLEQASGALAAAVRMPPAEQRERMASMRSLVSEFNVYRWAGRMLIDAAQLRRRERLSGRLTHIPEAAIEFEAR